MPKKYRNKIVFTQFHNKIMKKARQVIVRRMPI